MATIDGDRWRGEGRVGKAQARGSAGICKFPTRICLRTNLRDLFLLSVIDVAAC